VAVQPAIATGDGHGILLKADGSVWAWGANGGGQLGIGDGDYASEPVRVPGLANIRSVTAGEAFTVAVRGDGTVWAWGENSYGQLGNGSTSASRTPARVAGLTDVVMVAASRRQHYVLALKTDGSVWAWGENASGQGTAATGVKSLVPMHVQGLPGVKAIAAGENLSLALGSDGAVWVWGDHGAGDKCQGCISYSGLPQRVPGLSDVVAVAAGYQLTVALKSDGTVWSLGWGTAGQLGNGTTPNISSVPLQATGLTGVRAVAVGNSHVAALKSDGTVWSWGNNHSRQLGNAAVKDEVVAKPVRTEKLTGVIALAAAASHTVALQADGTVWAWGDNSDGALGTDKDTLASSDVPMMVGEDVPEKCTSPLFVCLTNYRGRILQICGDQSDARVDKWSNIQYRFGPESGPPDFVYPPDPAKGARSMYFSHEMRGKDYRLTLRFANGGTTYRVFSGTESGAGVEVQDGTGKTLSTISCAERPLIFIDYLRKNVACDLKNPHGAAACQEKPYGQR
jgi:alpha-tubulin suppressor-like RCC1 family protein